MNSGTARTIADGGVPRKGGGISVSFARHTVTAGMALLKPLGIQGEIALGGTWMQTHPNLKVGPLVLDAQDQYGLETFWKILLTPNVWATPGVQVNFDPAFNPAEDCIAVPHIKFRLFN